MQCHTRFFLICISRIFLEQKNDISRTFLEYLCNVIDGIFFKMYIKDIFRTKNDIPRTFLEHDCIFCWQTSRFMTQST